MDETELRAIVGNLETRSGDDGELKIGGYAALFNVAAPLPFARGLVEKVAKGAFSKSLKGDDGDIVLLLEHHVPAFARRSAGTLELAEDDKGLKFSASLPDSQAGRDIFVGIERGDFGGMSIGFEVRDEEGQIFSRLDDDTIERTLTDVVLKEASVVTFPVFADTSVATRAVQRWQEPASNRAAQRARMRMRQGRTSRGL